MRSIPNRRPSMLFHATLAGALALSATPLLADKLGNFEIQDPPLVVAPPQPTSQATPIQSPRDPASGQATGIQSPRDAASGQATSRQVQATGSMPSSLISGIDFPNAANPAAGGPAASKWEITEFDSGFRASQAGTASETYRQGGVNDTTHQRTARPAQENGALMTNEVLPSSIVSARDAASGQASGIQSPRDPASGQASGIQSPRDPASGQATARAQSASGMKSEVAIETLEVRSPRAVTANLGDTATHEAGHRSALPAGGTPAEIYSNNMGGGLLGVQAGQSATQTVREGGINDQTFRKGQPHRHRNGARGRRQHKP